MATFQQYVNKIDPNLDVNKKGTIVDPGPYEGIIKNNNDVRRTGRMDVFIPTFGGEETDPRSWIPVAYMSPFMGQTNKALLDKQESTALYSYGMWMTVPDPGAKVVVTFLEGARSKGVIIGCLIDNVNNHMVPGFASSKNWIKTAEVTELFPTFEPQKDFLPVLEYNPSVKRDSNQPISIARPVNIELAKILKEQGLISDTIRGHSFSTSHREGNSAVYGFATPGRSQDKDPAKDSALKTRMQNGEATQEDLDIRKRMPGHSFVLDDGDIAGESKLVRLRTSTGHQLLMDDTNGLIYVGTASGNAWIELTNNGDVHVYNKGNFNIHCEGSFNVHAGGNINMEATRGINVSSMDTSGIKVQASEGNIDMYSKTGTNNESAGPYHIRSDVNITMTTQDDNIHFNGPEANTATTPTRNDLLTNNGNRDVLNSTSTSVPEHEPWNRGTE